MCNVIDLIVRTIQLIEIKNTVHVFHVNTVDTILYGIYALNGTNVDTVDTTPCIFYLFLSRLVKEITYREYRRAHAKCIMPPPAVTDKKYKKGVYIACPLRWQRSALECLHEGAEAYMVSLLEDANLLAIHARQIMVDYGAAKGYTIGTKDKGGTKLV